METFGDALRRLRRKNSLTLLQLGELSTLGEDLVGQYERGSKRPLAEQIDRLARGLRLGFEDRVYLYALRSRDRKMPDPVPLEQEINQCIDQLAKLHVPSHIPVLILKNDHTIYWANRHAIEFTGLEPHFASKAIQEHISLFQIVFDPTFGLRNRIQLFDSVVLDLIRDLLAVNILRRHEIYEQFPSCFDQHDWFDEFKTLWDKALETHPYYELLTHRGIDLGGETLSIAGSRTQLTFYISRHSIPILANEYRIWRFKPHDDVTKAAYPSTV